MQIYLIHAWTCVHVCVLCPLNMHILSFHVYPVQTFSASYLLLILYRALHWCFTGYILHNKASITPLPGYWKPWLHRLYSGPNFETAWWIKQTVQWTIPIPIYHMCILPAPLPLSLSIKKSAYNSRYFNKYCTNYSTKFHYWIVSKQLDQLYGKLIYRLLLLTQINSDALLYMYTKRILTIYSYVQYVHFFTQNLAICIYF